MVTQTNESHKTDPITSARMTWLGRILAEAGIDVAVGAEYVTYEGIILQVVSRPDGLMVVGRTAPSVVPVAFFEDRTGDGVRQRLSAILAERIKYEGEREAAQRKGEQQTRAKEARLQALFREWFSMDVEVNGAVYRAGGIRYMLTVDGDLAISDGSFIQATARNADEAQAIIARITERRKRPVRTDQLERKEARRLIRR